MNQPYIKKYELVEGELVLQNPIKPNGYLNTGLNRKQRRNLMKSISLNNRANRYYYQPKNETKTVQTDIFFKDSLGNILLDKTITTTINVRSSIKHRFNHLRKSSVS